MTNWFNHICRLCTWKWSSTTTNFIVRPWWIHYPVCIDSTHQFTPVLAPCFENYLKLWPLQWYQIIVLYHGPFFIHSAHFSSMSNWRFLLLSIIHDNPTYWSATCITKGVMASFSSSSCNLWTGFFIKIVVFNANHIRFGALGIPKPYKNKNKINNEWSRFLGPFSQWATCSKIPWKRNYIISSQVILGQCSWLMLLSSYILEGRFINLLVYRPFIIWLVRIFFPFLN